MRFNKRRREGYKQKKIVAADINGAHTQLAVSQGNDDQLHDIRPSFIAI